MNLGDITYAEFSLLRDLVEAEQMRIWKEEWAPRLGKDISLDKISEIFHKVMFEDVGACEDELFQNLLTTRGCCAMLLCRINKEEKKVQGILRQQIKP